MHILEYFVIRILVPFAVTHLYWSPTMYYRILTAIFILISSVVFTMAIGLM